jgi:hypothetical protein
MAGFRCTHPDAGMLLVAGTDQTLEAPLEDVLVLDHRLELVLATTPVERLYDKSEWFHGAVATS